MVLFLRKSQIATEFIILSGIALFITIIFVFISLDQSKELYEKKEFLKIQDIALIIQKEISMASYVEDGYTREFKIPEKIDNKDYNIYIINNTLSVFTDTLPYTVNILNVTGELNKGSNTIKKTNGKVFLN